MKFGIERPFGHQIGEYWPGKGIYHGWDEEEKKGMWD